MAYNPDQPRDRYGRWTSSGVSYRQNTSYKELLSQDTEYNYNPEEYFTDSQKNEYSGFEYSDSPTIWIPKTEYAMVMHELATNLTDEEHQMPVVIKHIRNFTYKIVIHRFGNYRIIGKYKIKVRKRKK